MEMEADEVGLVLAAKACFDVRMAPQFWGKMALTSEEPLANEVNTTITYIIILKTNISVKVTPFVLYPSFNE